MVVGLGSLIGNLSLYQQHSDCAEAWILLKGERFDMTLSRGPFSRILDGPRLQSLY